MKIIIKEYNFTYELKLDDGISCGQFVDNILELTSKVYPAETVEDHLKHLYDRS
jgi:hypothetical protein